MNTPALLSALISDPARIVEGGDIARDAPRLLGMGALAAAAVGAAGGSQHEGILWLYTAIKMPVIFLLPPLLLVPALSEAAALLHHPMERRRVVLAALCTSARAAVFGAAMAPLLWLLADWDGRYRVGVLLLLAVLGAAGLTGLQVLAALTRGMLPMFRGLWLLMATLLFGLLAGQTGWHLRPFVLRPELPVVFLDQTRGDILTTLRMRLQGPPRALQQRARYGTPEEQQAVQEQLRSLGYTDTTVEAH